MSAVPIVDVQDRGVAIKIGRACRDVGFFYVVGHSVPTSLVEQLTDISRQFFAQSHEEKMRIQMVRGGSAWRGYFPVGSELTSGKPDQKEGLYLGSNLSIEDPRVATGLPLHGPNLYPEIPGFGELVETYLAAVSALAADVLRLLAQSLELPPTVFEERYTFDPLILFRIFHYPSLIDVPAESTWSVGEHTDYGLLTVLHQDLTGGLQVKVNDSWIDAAPIPDSFVCNIGDMLDRLTGGRLRSTPHRVANISTQDRLSFAFFYDPSFEARIDPLLPPIDEEDVSRRWDGVSVRGNEPTYGDYLIKKIGKVFPSLAQSKLKSHLPEE